MCIRDRAYTEKNGTYVNTEGRVQLARQAVQPPGDAREDWTILRALSGVLGGTLDYVTLGDVRAAMAAANPLFERVNEIADTPWGDFGAAGGTGGAMDGAPFESPIGNYYMTDPISRASETMAECTREFVGGAGARTGTDG